jgi:hypothetical protein
MLDHSDPRVTRRILIWQVSFGSSTLMTSSAFKNVFYSPTLLLLREGAFWVGNKLLLNLNPEPRY